MSDLVDRDTFEPDLDEALFPPELDDAWPAANPDLAWFPELTPAQAADSHGQDGGELLETQLLTPTSEEELGQMSYFGTLPSSASPLLTTELPSVDIHSSEVTQVYGDVALPPLVHSNTDPPSRTETITGPGAAVFEDLSPSLPDLSWSPSPVGSPSEGLLLDGATISVSLPQQEAVTAIQNPAPIAPPAGFVLPPAASPATTTSTVTATTTAAAPLVDPAITWLAPPPPAAQLQPEHDQSSPSLSVAVTRRPQAIQSMLGHCQSLPEDAPLNDRSVTSRVIP